MSKESKVEMVRLYAISGGFPIGNSYQEEVTSATELHARIISAFDTLKTNVLVLRKLKENQLGRARLCEECYGGDFEQYLRVTSRGAKKKRKEYSIKPITAKDKDTVIDLLKRFFLPYEPLAMAVKLLPDSQCIEFENYIAISLENRVSLAAVTPNGEFVGIVINGLLRRSDIIDESEADKCPNPQFKQIMKVLMHLRKKSNLWDKVPASCNIVMDLMMAATHTEWRRQSIMKVLAKESEDVAKKAGACGICMDATSIFSGRAAERLGYKNIYSTKYTDIIEGLEPKKPHTVVSVYLKVF